MSAITRLSIPHSERQNLRFQAAFDAAALGIGVCHLDGGIIEANPALARMLGCAPEELATTHSRALFSEVSDHLPNQARNQTLRRKHLEFQSTTRAESRKPLPRSGQTQEDHLLGELLRGERDAFEIRKLYTRKDGSSIRGHLNGSLARDTQGRATFLIVTLSDATEHKRLEDQLRQAERLEAIGRLAGGIAHDFNNLLTGILLYCDLLSAGLAKLEDQPAALSHHVAEVRMAGEQGAALTKQLLAVARNQPAEPQPALINEIVRSMEGLLRRLIGERIALVTRLDAATAPVLVDRSQLRQLVMNLVLNARDAMPEGGTIEIVTRQAHFPRASARTSADISDGTPCGAATLLAVSDDGCGMTTETRQRLFEPFFTTKNPGQGTGIGLATVHRIVSDAHGVIALESEPGRGTSVEVYLPALAKTSAFRSRLPHAAADGPTSPPTVLLVDDDLRARRSIERVLSRTGCRIFPAATGKRALKLFAQHSAHVDLLLADYMLPGMNGGELAETLRQQKPGLKVLFISSYDHSSLDPALRSAALLRKPFTAQTLIDCIDRLLRDP